MTSRSIKQCHPKKSKKLKHSRQIAGKSPSLTRLMHSVIETEKEKRNKLTNFSLFFSMSESVLIKRAVSVGF